MTPWDEKQYVYLASADQWEGMNPFFTKYKVKQCKNFYSVIGGLGGLNILSKLNRPKNVIFFDINKYAFNICKLQIELIFNSNNINDYISNIFCRVFDMSKFSYLNQDEFLLQEFDENRLSRVIIRHHDLYSP